MRAFLAILVGAVLLAGGAAAKSEEKEAKWEKDPKAKGGDPPAPSSQKTVEEPPKGEPKPQKEAKAERTGRASEQESASRPEAAPASQAREPADGSPEPRKERPQRQPEPADREKRGAAREPVAPAVPVVQAEAFPPIDPEAPSGSENETVLSPPRVEEPSRVEAVAAPAILGAGRAPADPAAEAWETANRLLRGAGNQSPPSPVQPEGLVPSGGTPPAMPWAIWILGAVFGAGMGAAAVRSLARPRSTLSRRLKAIRAGTPGGALSSVSPLGLQALLARVQRVPHDAEACFLVATQLLMQGSQEMGLRYLDRSLRLNPLHVLRLLQEADLAPVREHPEVQALLKRLKNDYDRRAWTGYA